MNSVMLCFVENARMTVLTSARVEVKASKEDQSRLLMSSGSLMDKSIAMTRFLLFVHDQKNLLPSLQLNPTEDRGVKGEYRAAAVAEHEQRSGELTGVA